MAKWKTVAPGIRYREHESRRHGKQADRYYTLRHTVNGRQAQESLGWASEGWTVARAQVELGKLLEAKRTGEGAQSLRERRDQRLRQAQQQAEAEAYRQRSEKRVSDLWARYDAEIAAHNKPSTRAEKQRIWR